MRTVHNQYYERLKIRKPCQEMVTKKIMTEDVNFYYL
jgi:hypothetical protein